MKVEGHHFKRGMNNNIVTIIDNTIQIHSYDDLGSGILRKEALGFIQRGELHFAMNKKDFALLKNFNEMEISMKGETIIVQSGKTKLKFQNQTNVKEFSPALGQPISLNLPIEILQEAAGYVGETDRARGILVTPECIASCDGIALYRFEIVTGIDHKIFVPPAMLKLLDKDTGYEMKLCGDLIAAYSGDEIVYSNLYDFYDTGIEKIKMDGNGFIKVFSDQLIRHLNLASNFSDIIFFNVDDKKVTLETFSREGQVSSYSAEIQAYTNITRFKKGCQIKYLLRILRSAPENATLIISDRPSFKIEEESKTVLTMGALVPHPVDLKTE